MLLWHFEEGKEYSDWFNQPQSWAELLELTNRNDEDRLPQVLKTDGEFALMFLLVFPHRAFPSLVKHLDQTIIGNTKAYSSWSLHLPPMFQQCRRHV